MNLSAAETIGTSKSIEYSFKSEGGDQVMIKKTSEGTAIAALRFGTPTPSSWTTTVFCFGSILIPTRGAHEV